MAHLVRFFRNVAEINDLNKPSSRIGKSRAYDRKGTEIQGFSSRSKVRLHRLLERINHPTPPLFVTLTYQLFPADWRESKLHLQRWLKRLRRIDPKLSGVWRLEYQRRGAPHYHLVLWPSNGRAESHLLDRDGISRDWCECSDQGSRAARMHSCRVDAADRPDAVFRYLVGHHVKSDQVRPDDYSGRYWGIVGRDYLGGLEPVREETCDDSVARRYRRLCAKYQERRLRARGYATQRILRAILREECREIFIPLHDQARLFECAKATVADEPF